MDLNYLKTTKQVAKMLGCTSRNVAFLVKGAKLKPIKVLENGTFLFNTKDVEYYLLKLQNHE
jgi:DNA-binding transcriptional MerR regulator